MKKALLLSFCLLSPLAAQAQEIRPGLWEFKSSASTPDMPDMAAQMAEVQAQLASLPPEQRRMVEQQMAASGVGMTRNGNIRTCITPEEAARNEVYKGSQEDDCTYTKVQRSGNTIRGEIACSNPKSRGSFVSTIHGREHFSSRMDMQSAEGRMQASTDARWVSADCGKLRPRP